MYKTYGNCQYLRVPPPIRCDYVNVVSEEKECASVFAPEVWGEAFWFILHVGSLAARDQIPEQEAVKYWNFIEGIPLMLPCKRCSRDAQQIVDAARPRWRDVCASRDSLLEFFLDFHNRVNEKQGKPAMTRADIERLAAGNVRVATIRYF